MKATIINELKRKYDDLYSFSWITPQDHQTRYFDPQDDPNRLMNVKSVSKLIVALAVGCAIERGYVRDLDMDIRDVLNRTRYPRITLRQCLTMRAGIPYREGKDQSAWLNSEHWLDAYLCKTTAIERDAPFIYATPNVYLISVFLQELTKKHLFDFADEVLFQPLGIKQYHCQKSPQGYDYGGSDFEIAAADMAKIVQLVCHHGNHSGKQIVAASWIDAMLTPYVTVRANCHYGYLAFRYHSPTCRNPYWIIPGSGGQYAFVAPKHKSGMLVIAKLPNARMNLDPLQNDFCDELCHMFEDIIYGR